MRRIRDTANRNTRGLTIEAVHWTIERAERVERMSGLSGLSGSIRELRSESRKRSRIGAGIYVSGSRIKSGMTADLQTCSVPLSVSRLGTARQSLAELIN